MNQDTASVCIARRWTRPQVFSVLHDVWTVGSSVIDIIADIAVTVQFYQMGERARPFFYGSLIIFATAQIT